MTWTDPETPVALSDLRFCGDRRYICINCNTNDVILSSCERSLSSRDARGMAQAMHSKLGAASASQTPRSSRASASRVLRSPLRPAGRTSRHTVQAQQSDGGVSPDAALSRRQAMAAGAVGGLVGGSMLGGGLALPRPARAEEEALAEAAAPSPPQEPTAALAPAEQSPVSSQAMDRIELGRSGAQPLGPKPCGRPASGRWTPTSCRAQGTEAGDLGRNRDHTGFRVGNKTKERCPERLRS